ncbi:MAG: glycosyltransferase WbuB [Planctomycetes bacterium]|jgi:glycosyltransferase involved in cell wall biosynthesis|nr:glycosyltransferase WbuB [Planctomycetota bacterium]
MRILYHHRTQAEDGQAIHIRAMIDAFESLGHEVAEVSLVKRTAAREGRARGQAAEQGSNWGWVTRLPRFARELAEYGYNGLARHTLMKEATFFEPHFLYERYAFGNAAGVLAARRLRRPMVLEVNSPMVVELEKTRGLSFPRLARRVEDFVFQSADRVCAVTEVLAEMLVRQGVERERILVTPNGVDLERYTVEDRAAAKQSARRRLGLPTGQGRAPLVLGFVGYCRPWHRLDVCLRALEHPDLQHAVLALIGEGPAHEELTRLADERNLSDRLFFCGSRPHAEIPELLHAFDVGLIPAINPYASPLKLHEYMAASLPVIAPDQPNLREVLTPERDALLVPAGDHQAMAAALVRLGTDEAQRRRLGAAARTTIEERNLTWRANARRVVAAMKEVT